MVGGKTLMDCRLFGQEQIDVPRSGEFLWGRDSSTQDMEWVDPSIAGLTRLEE